MAAFFGSGDGKDAIVDPNSGIRNEVSPMNIETMIPQDPLQALAVMPLMIPMMLTSQMLAMVGAACKGGQEGLVPHTEWGYQYQRTSTAQLNNANIFGAGGGF